MTKKMAAKKQISQETFDECVRENVEEFDMDLVEATRDAIQQFESQQVDLSNIIKHVRAASGADSGGAQPENILDQIKRIIKELEALAEKAKGSACSSEDEQRIVANLTQLQALCDEVPEAAVVAGRNNAIDALLDLIDGAASSAYKSASVLETASAALTTLCTDNTDNQDFVGQSGMVRLAAVLNALSTTESNASTAARVLALVKTVCAKHEANKTHFTNAQGVDAVFAHFERATQDESLSKQLAFVLRVLTVNDDPNATFSQAQETIKQLVAKDVIPYILGIVRGNHEKPEMLSVWLVVLKQLAITEDNCKKIYELEGLELLQQVMVQHEKHLAVMTRCITVFRNVAAADELKAYIIKSGGIERVLTGMRLHLGDPSLQQHACATLAAVALRAPENSLRIVDLGGARQIAFAMRSHRENTALLRQASLAIRNMVARCVELRPRILEEDIEPLLRDAQRYRGCGDEAYAALRDLGCDIQLSSFGSVATTAQFNPVNIASNQLLESVDEVAEAPFARQR
ncbi:hypothetical protein FI667_g3008, partial [Globisporangium splendens]